MQRAKQTVTGWKHRPWPYAYLIGLSLSLWYCYTNILRRLWHIFHNCLVNITLSKKIVHNIWLKHLSQLRRKHPSKLKSNHLLSVVAICFTKDQPSILLHTCTDTNLCKHHLNWVQMKMHLHITIIKSKLHSKFQNKMRKTVTAVILVDRKTVWHEGCHVYFLHKK